MCNFTWVRTTFAENKIEVREYPMLMWVALKILSTNNVYKSSSLIQYLCRCS